MRLFALGLLVLAGCRSTTTYAVRVYDEDLKNDHGCFRQCQQARAGNVDAYISCLRTCPDVEVDRGETCETVHLDSGDRCMDERYTRFAVGRTVWLIIGINALVYAIAVNAP